MMMRVTSQSVVNSVLQRGGHILKFVRTKVTKRFLNKSKEETLPGKRKYM